MGAALFPARCFTQPLSQASQVRSRRFDPQLGHLRYPGNVYKVASVQGNQAVWFSLYGSRQDRSIVWVNHLSAMRYLVHCWRRAYLRFDGPNNPLELG
jgi:hypothetical protein